LDKFEIIEHEKNKYEKVWEDSTYRIADNATEFWSEYCTHIENTERIIDFGCGTGKLVHKLSEYGYDVYGVDIAKNSVNEEIYKKDPFKFLFQSISDMNEKSIGYFDVGICVDVMEHIPAELVEETMVVMTKLCNETYYLIEGILDYAGRKGREPLHLTVRSIEWWIELAEKMGIVEMLHTPKSFTRPDSYFFKVTRMDNFINQIKSSDVKNTPVKHMITQNIFSESLYNKILDNWPPLDSMTYAPSHLSNRNWIYIYGHDPLKKDKHIDDLPKNDMTKFWIGIGQYLGSQEVKRAFFTKFGLDLELSSFHTVRVLTDVQGYAIAPHPDGYTKVLNALLYCPVDDSQPHWGTHLEGVLAPFIKNNMFSFVRSSKSIHWVERILEKNAKRNQILLVYERNKE